MFLFILSHYVVGNVYLGDAFIENFNWSGSTNLTSVRVDVEYRTKIVIKVGSSGGTRYGDWDESSHQCTAF